MAAVGVLRSVTMNGRRGAVRDKRWRLPDRNCWSPFIRALARRSRCCFRWMFVGGWHLPLTVCGSKTVSEDSCEHPPGTPKREPADSLL